MIRKLRPSLRKDWFHFDGLHQIRLLGCAAKDSDDWALLGSMLGFTIKAVFGNAATLAQIQTTVQEVMCARDAVFPKTATNAYRKLTSFRGIGPGVATRVLTLARPDRLVSLNSASRQGLADYAGLFLRHSAPTEELREAAPMHLPKAVVPHAETRVR